MPRMITLKNGRLSVTIAPDLGASIVAFEFVASGNTLQVFRPVLFQPNDTFQTALQLLAPWVNRISGGGFFSKGAWFDLSPNLPTEQFPIHGNAFQSSWTVADADQSSVTLTLSSEGPAPYRYAAKFVAELTDETLCLNLTIKNLGEFSLPFSSGFHPWFHRDQDTTLQAKSTSVWLEDSDYIPFEAVSSANIEDFNFDRPATLPARWINNAFTGWDGIARISWPSRGLGLDIIAEGLNCFHVYSPSDTAGFFCFEPTTAIPNAPNLVPYPELGSARNLQPNECLGVSVTFRPFELSS